MQPYTKRVLSESDDGAAGAATDEDEDKEKDTGTFLVGIDKPRGDKAVWMKARFSKLGPVEAEVLQRGDWMDPGEGAKL